MVEALRFSPLTKDGMPTHNDDPSRESFTPASVPVSDSIVVIPLMVICIALAWPVTVVLTPNAGQLQKTSSSKVPITAHQCREIPRFIPTSFLDFLWILWRLAQSLRSKAQGGANR